MTDHSGGITNMVCSDAEIERLHNELIRLETSASSLPLDEMMVDISYSEVKALLNRLSAAEQVAQEAAHDDPCIRNRNEAGEPTEDGGYRMKYAGTWYQSRPVDETPKCNCGLDEKFEAWQKTAGR